MVGPRRAPRRHDAEPAADGATAGAPENPRPDAHLGNQALISLLGARGITISHPTAASEREADAVSLSVDRSPGRSTPSSGRAGSGEPAGRSSTPTTAPTDLPAELAVPGGGHPLGAAVRSALEPVVGADLGGVRVHAGPAAAATARHLEARALTVGSAVVLGAGESASDLPLMAHEAAHVAQGQPARVQRAPVDTPRASALAELEYLKVALTPDQYAMLEDGAISRLAVPLFQLMHPESIEHLERADMLATVFPQLATYEGPTADAAQLVARITESETLRMFLADKLRSPVTIVVDEYERPPVRFYLYDLPLPTENGMITVGALNAVSIATTDAIAAHQYEAASQLIDIRMAQAKAEHAMNHALPLAALVLDYPADYALQEVQDLAAQCDHVTGYVASLSGALIGDNADLAPQVGVSLEMLTTVKTMTASASAAAARFATTYQAATPTARPTRRPRTSTPTMLASAPAAPWRVRTGSRPRCSTRWGTWRLPVTWTVRQPTRAPTAGA